MLGLLVEEDQARVEFAVCQGKVSQPAVVSEQYICQKGLQFVPLKQLQASLAEPLKSECLKSNLREIQYIYNQTVFQVSYRIRNYFLKICAH